MDSERWIPVSEKLPPRNEVVLCFHESTVGIGYLLIGTADWFIVADRPRNHDIGAPVTHWMPLPAPPPNQE